MTGRTLCGLLIQMQNISLRSSGMHKKENFEIVFGLKSDTTVLTFTFHFLSSLFIHFSCFIFFGWQDFHGNFQVNVTWFFAFFWGVLDWNLLILVWFERSLHSAQVTCSGQSCVWPLKLITSQEVEGTWVCTGGYGWFRGKWVNEQRGIDGW